MSDFMEIVTPPERAAEPSYNSPSSPSASVVSTSSLARWRQTNAVSDGKNASPGQSSTTNDRKHTSDEKRPRRLPQVIFTEATEREVASAHHSAREFGGSGASPNPSTSIEERSYRPIVSDSVRRSPGESQLDMEKESGFIAGAAPAASVTPQSQRVQQQRQQRTRHGDPHVVAGDEPVRWSFASASPLHSSQYLQEQQQPELQQLQQEEKTGKQRSSSSSAVDAPTAIAAAVPAIAQERNSAVEAYSSRWTAEVQRSTASEEECIHAYRQLETKLRNAERRIATAEAKQQREVTALKAQLAQEQAAREKAERDREELLNQATMSPALTPRTTGSAGGGVLHVSVEGGARSRSGGHNGGTATASAEDAGRAATATSATTTTYISEAFYEQMKEREDRARARVRKEFVRQAQESVYAEQKKTAEAEKTAALATRRLQQAEEELHRAQDALQEANSVMEAKDVQLHERAIHIQELEAQLRLVQRQLESTEEAKAQGDAVARRKLEEVQKLAELRQGELEAQRGFAQQLQEQLGLKTRDLFDQESSQQSVLQLVVGLQTRCKALESDLETAVRDATALLDQRRQHAEGQAAMLQQRNEELLARCTTAEGEVAAMQGQHACDAKEMALLRERYETDLSEQHVEVRSLQLQLEKVLAAAKHRTAESASATEIERQQHAMLLRKYAAEATAAHEELDRTRAIAQRENEKHLRTILELSQQLTALKHANTRLEHQVNIHEHESADATRLLSRAREELTQLREERRRLSASLVDFREDSRMRSALDSQDVLQRRVAELENVRRDLSQQLLCANQTVEDMQRRSQFMAEQSSRYAQSDSHRAPSVQGVVFAEMPPRFSSSASARPRETHVHEKEDEKLRQPSRSSIVSTTPSMGLPELLESMVGQLEPILHPLSHPLRGDSAKGKSADTAAVLPSSSLPATLRERRLQQALSPGERDALDRVLASCTAALRCSATEKHIVDSPSRPYTQNTAEEEEEGGQRNVPIAHGGAENTARERQEMKKELAPLLGKHSPAAAQPSPLPSQWQSSPAADLHEPQRDQQQQQQYSAEVLKADLPSPQRPLARPRRSSQPSLSSVATDDYVMRFSHTSEAFPTPLAQRYAETAAAAAAAPAFKATQRMHEEKKEREESQKGNREPKRREHGDAEADRPKNAKEAAREVHAEEVENRAELESEPCWDSHASEQADASHKNNSAASASSSSSLSSHVSSKQVIAARARRSDGGVPAEPTAKAASSSNALAAHPRRSVASVTASSAAGSASPSAGGSVPHSTRDAALAVQFSPTTPAGPMTVEGILSITQMRADVEGDGIVRYSRIPEEALSPFPRGSSRAVPAAVDSDGGPSLFSNVQYVSAGSSLSRSPHHHRHHRDHEREQQPSYNARELRNVTSSTTGHSHHRQQATVPGGALVIDVRQSTPPPPRKRVPLH